MKKFAQKLFHNIKILKMLIFHIIFIFYKISSKAFYGVRIKRVILPSDVIETIEKSSFEYNSHLLTVNFDILKIK